MAPSATEEKNGAHSRAAPISSSTTKELHVGEARAAELLGDGQRLQAQLVGHLAPHGGVVPVGRVHQAAHLGLGRLLRQEPAHRGAQLVLLVTEGEIHARAPSASSRPAVSRSVSTRRKSGGDQMCDAGVMGQLEQIWSDATAEVHQIVVGPMDNNVYILRCRRTGDAMLIDAANEHEELLEICQQLGVNQVVETHGHWDHIQAVPAVREAGISVAVTSADAGMLPSYDLILEDDEQLSVGDLRLKTLATPGHTPGSICFAVEGTNLLFTGDTLFPGGPGNTTFENADFDTIIQSIDRRIFAAFGPDTLVLPGHGTSTTVGNESPHLGEWVERGW